MERLGASLPLVTWAAHTRMTIPTPARQNAMPGPRSLLGGLDGGLDEVHHLTVAGTED